MGEGDVDLDTALAEMEMDEMDDNMDGKLEKAEFLKWLASKKAELNEMEPSKAAAAPAKSGDAHAGVKDANAWGSDPTHHSAAIKIQSVERGRRVRKPVVDGEIEVIDEGIELLQDRVRNGTASRGRGGGAGGEGELKIAHSYLPSSSMPPPLRCKLCAEFVWSYFRATCSWC